MEEVSQLKNVIWEPRYDVSELDENVTEVNFFAEKINGELPISGKKKSEINTNMVAEGQMPIKNVFYIMGIRLYFPRQIDQVDSIVTVQDAFFYSSILEFSSQSKSFLKVPTEVLCGGVGNYNPTLITTHGQADPRAVWTLQNWAIKLDALQDFEVKVRLEAPIVSISPGNIFRVKCQLDGVLSRPVN